MNCEQFRDVVHDVARDESLGFVTIHEAREHADRCIECEALLVEAEMLNAGLEALADQHATEETPADVEVALLRSFRQSHRLPVSRFTRAWQWSVVGVGSIAAAVLLTVAMTHYVKHASPLSAQSGQTTATAAQAGDPAAVADEVDASLTSSPFEDSVDGWPAANDGSTNSAAVSFVPLSEEFDPTSLDVSAVVRVAMPRSALENLGVYLDEGEDDGSVIADLVVSDDGTPQAIRVVSW